MIGQSLSSCALDIALGNVQWYQVEKVVAGTRCPNRATFEEVIDRYLSSCWKNHPEAADIARKLWEQGKIEQPRLLGKNHHLTKLWID